MLPSSPNTTVWALSAPAKALWEAHILSESFQAWYSVGTLNPLSTGQEVVPGLEAGSSGFSSLTYKGKTHEGVIHARLK